MLRYNPNKVIMMIYNTCKSIIPSTPSILGNDVLKYCHGAVILIYGIIHMYIIKFDYVGGRPILNSFAGSLQSI